MTPQEIEALKVEGLTDKVESLSTMVELLKDERDALTDKVEQLEWCLKDRKAVCHQAFDANEALKAERDALSAQVNFLLEVIDNSGAYKVCQELCDARHKTPQQCLRDAEAEAGRKGFIAGCHCGANYNIHDWDNQADEYAATVRQGGAE